ncbi:MAG: DUF4159 domain-containing protein [Phycisphaerales bacterium]|nr:DUF4159 domain-containing protein [Phycisphaerales bacterium]
MPKRRLPVTRPIMHGLILVSVVTGPVAVASDPTVTDARVEDAVQRAVAWIKSKATGEFWEQHDKGHQHYGGDTALALLALLYAGEDPRGDEIGRALGWLNSQTLKSTYAFGTRAHALALLPDRMHRSRLEADVTWLVSAMGRQGEGAGAYDYLAAEDGTLRRWDNSNSQFGVLGVWMAAEAGVAVPDSYWDLVGRYWLRSQNADGGWGYMEREDSTGSMTAAGVASLFVVLDQRFTRDPREGAEVQAAVDTGLRWLGRSFDPEQAGNEWHFYYLYGIERAGRASGYKSFAGKEWFRASAAWLLRQQRPGGSWEGTGGDMTEFRNTAFALMVLCHGRAPLTFNKLEHGAGWNAQPRDVAGLTRYFSRSFERLMNWQIVKLDSTLDELLEAPVLYLYGTGRTEYTPVEAQKIREYCLRGGLVFAVSGDASGTFRRSIEELARQAFPELTLRPVSAEHPLLSGVVQFPLEGDYPLLEVANGVRTLLLLLDRDLAQTWSRAVPRGAQLRDFELAANVFLYATDKVFSRSRLQTPNIALENTAPTRTIAMARIAYDGPWDPEPYGWTRLRAHLHNRVRTNLLVTSGIRFDSEVLSNFSIAHITGTGPFTLSDEERRGLRHFLNSGGTLLADAAGATPGFVEALESELRAATRSEPRALRSTDYIVTGAGIPDAVDLSTVAFRRNARRMARGQTFPPLLTFGTRRRLQVIYSPLDLSAGLLGTQVYDLVGYEPEATLRIMQNLLLYAALPTAEKATLARED